MLKRLTVVGAALLAVAAGAHFALTDEGQWTPDQIARLDLRRAGLRIPVNQVFNPGGAGIHEAVILLGGGTAEFVSPEGLIMTNHHVAFGAVARIATAEEDYITDGYLARTPAEEIRAQGYTASIVQFYEDVTPRVLQGVGPELTWEERQAAIRRNTSALLDEARGAHPDLRMEVSTLSYGNAFKLIGFLIIPDIRIVYVPPFAIGNFGAETDNWMFPRHTGDFSFMRAYVGPDGKPAPYSASNVPYRPRTWLKTARTGPKEGDFAFLLGFPGTTMRYRDSYYLDYEYTSRLPYEIMIRGERIDVMNRAAEGDRALQIRFAETVKGLANTYKNYQGKVVGMARADLTSLRRAEEAEWTRWYRGRPGMQQRYDGVLEALDGLFAEARRDDPLARTIGELTWSPVQQLAVDVYEFLVQTALPEADRGPAWRGAGLERQKNRLLAGPGEVYLPLDRELYRRAAVRALDLPPGERLATFTAIVEGQELRGYAPVLEAAIEEAYASSPLLQATGREELLGLSPEEGIRRGGLFLRVAAEIRESSRRLGERQRARSAEQTRLWQRYAEGIMAYRESRGKTLYPDANRSLRFSYGSVLGYDPKDAVHIRPFTHLTGVIEKATGEGEFIVPAALEEAWRQKRFGPWKDASGDVPVDFLTTCDTTGGNSGSPVMNARGELIGINFDRVWEATVNDYNFDPDFGRNISVDMRYILLVCATFGADRVVKELGW
jgi:hypothetical protein